MPVKQAPKIWRIISIKSFKGEGGNFKLDASVNGQPVKILQNGGTRISISFACNAAQCVVCRYKAPKPKQ